MTAPRLSVIVPCRITGEEGLVTRGSLLRLALTALDCQTVPRDAYEVVVVDDGSDIPLAELLHGFLDGLTVRPRIIRNDGPGHGQMPAYAMGVCEARGDSLLLSTDDTALAPDAVGRHIEAHATASAPVYVCGVERQYIYGVLFKDISAGVLHRKGDLAVRTFGSLVGIPDIMHTAEQLGFVDWTVTPNDIRHRFPEIARRAALTPGFRDMYSELDSDRTDLRWLTVRMGNHSISRPALNRLGGLDDAVPAGNSDQHLGLRLQAAGIGIAPAGHAISVLFEHRRALRSFQNGAGLEQLARLWPRPDVIRLGEYFSRGYRRSIADYRRSLSR